MTPAAYCRPRCTEADGDPCTDHGGLCENYGSFSVCSTLCDPSTPFAGCPAGFWCAARSDLGDRAGACTPAGRAEEGEPCAGEPCDAGLLCYAPYSPFSMPPTCYRACGEPGPDACGGDPCVGVPDQPSLPHWCSPTCDPREMDPVAAGCVPGTRCAPDFSVPGGHCVPEGGVPLGGPCTSQLECARGLACAAEGLVDGSGVAGTCMQLCDPSLPPGGCPAGEVCAVQTSISRPTPIGLCRPGCGFDEGIFCADAALTCVPEELTGAGVDACYSIPRPYLPPETPCSVVSTESEPCGALAMCTVGDHRCHRVCRADKGDFLQNGHPDCPGIDEYCAPLDGVTDYGTCF